jgi:hypothetical protein
MAGEVMAEEVSVLVEEAAVEAAAGYNPARPKRVTAIPVSDRM